MSRDASRTSALLAEGLVPYQFTYAQVVDDQAYVLATLGATLTAESRLRRG